MSIQSGASRRAFLAKSLGVAVGVAGLTAATASPAAAAFQLDWRFCRKCYVMSFVGYPSKGVCAAGGAHTAQGLHFVMHYNMPAEPNWQSDWRFCEKCYSLFWQGSDPARSYCPAGGQHLAQGSVFQCHFDVPLSPSRQPDWRYCRNCESMFYGGYPDKGRCKYPHAGGGHVAQGRNFVMHLVL